MRKHVPKAGHVLQAYSFALDPNAAQSNALRSHFGARRFACNWAVERMKGDLEAYRESGLKSDPPSLAGMRRWWNRVKGEVTLKRGKTGVEAEKPECWWPEVSKEAFSSGIADAVRGYWNWRKSRSGEREGPRVGFPRFRRKGADSDRYRVTTGSFGPVDHRHVKVPRVGIVRVHESMRRMTRLQARGRLKILSMTLSRSGKRMFAVFQVEVLRWAETERKFPVHTVGVDVGVRRLATVASPQGVLGVVENPRALDSHLKKLSRLYRDRSRCASRTSVRYRKRTEAISALHRRIADERRLRIHILTTRLAKSHGRIVVEGCDFSGLMGQCGAGGGIWRTPLWERSGGN